MKRRQVLLAGAALATSRQTAAQVAASTPAIDWPVIQLLDGGAFEPESWQGQVAVVVFWATYCPYCRRHNARLDKLYRATRGQPLRVLGVALDSDGDGVRRYMATNGYRFPVTLDDGTLRPRFTPRRVIPMTCVLDRQSRLRQTIPGEMSEDDMLGLARLASRAAG